MQEVLDLVRRVAPSDATVLLRGESGTGKELIAKAIHYASARRNGPLVKVNCAALPETLLESELFGHEKGAFTGAFAMRKGRFEVADGGTLFLDEIGDLPAHLQAKLLRVLQEKEFERVGSNRAITTDVRIITATHRDLEQLMREGSFREDLYYRLNVVTIILPPLRERRQDLPALVEHFLRKFAEKNGKTIQGFSREARDALLRYDYPGNVRELENLVERAIVLTPRRRGEPGRAAAHHQGNAAWRGRPDQPFGRRGRDGAAHDRRGPGSRRRGPDQGGGQPRNQRAGPAVQAPEIPASGTTNNPRKVRNRVLDNDFFSVIP